MSVFGEYTLAAAGAVIAVVLLELLVLRAGVFLKAKYWCALAIVLAFQVPVDGWLTRADDPIVSYAPAATSGLRFPWDIPVEDFAFGFALLTLALSVWERFGGRRGMD